MCNVRMIRTEPGLVSIPLEKAVYCENCKWSRLRPGGGAVSADRRGSSDWLP